MERRSIQLGFATYEANSLQAARRMAMDDLDAGNSERFDFLPHQQDEPITVVLCREFEGN